MGQLPSRLVLVASLGLTPELRAKYSAEENPMVFGLRLQRDDPQDELEFEFRTYAESDLPKLGE